MFWTRMHALKAVTYISLRIDKDGQSNPARHVNLRTTCAGVDESGPERSDAADMGSSLMRHADQQSSLAPQQADQPLCSSAASSSRGLAPSLAIFAQDRPVRSVAAASAPALTSASMALR